MNAFRSSIIAVVTLAVASSAAAAPLIPRTVLLGNPDKTSPQISPDGARLAYLAPNDKGVINVWVKTIDKQDAVVVTQDRRGILEYTWAPDGDHLLFLADTDGDENWHVLSVDLKTRLVRDLTPFQGIKSQNLMAAPGAHHILVGMNLRDRAVFDMYRIDLTTGAVTLETQNPGDVLSFTADHHLAIRAATAFDPKTGATILRVRNSEKDAWRDLLTWPFEQSSFLGQVNGGSVTAGFLPDGESLYVASFASSDKVRLERVDAKTGRTLEVVAEHPKADVAWELGNLVEPIVIKSEATGRLEAVAFQYFDLEWTFTDPKIKEDFARLSKVGAGQWKLINRDKTEKRWVVARKTSDAPTRYYLYDRPSGRTTFLFSDSAALEKLELAKKKAVTIPARDGLELISYLTLPTGVEAKKLPLVLYVHGGPWFRDDGSFDPVAQLLANRGYAVLQVNFRGSTGFGKRFFNAGNQQVGLGMQEDLNDAVKWAIAGGIADPKRVAIMGGSFGGYATLRGVTENPEQYACGVDIVGPSDLALLFRTMPSYWAPVKTRWKRRLGDVEQDDALNRKLSPLYHAGRIRAAMLIAQGANDVRVKIENSDRMVAAMRANNVPVEYVVYPDEGHGFTRPENNLDFFGRVERHFAKCLGGLAEPWTKIEGSTAQLR